MVVNTDLFQLKSFIDRGIYNVGEALVIGAVLVVIVLFLFLLNFRTTFITLTAIPLSLVITTLVFRLIGVLTGTELSINVMTLGGIAVAMGELVDDAIVDVENIFRRLRREQRLPRTRSPPLRGRLRSQPRDPLGHRLRHGGRHPGVPAAVRPVRRRRPAVRPARRRLHRVDPGLAAGVADRHAGAVVLPAAAVEGDPRPPGRSAAAGAEVGGGLPDPLQHAARRRAAAADLGAGRRQRLGN